MSEASTVSWRDYVDRRFADLQEHIDDRLDAHEKAVDLARAELLARLEGMNEFRSQILTERGNFARREQVEALFAQLETKVESMEKSINIARGRDMGILGLSLTVVFGLITVAIKLVAP